MSQTSQLQSKYKLDLKEWKKNILYLTALERERIMCNVFFYQKLCC